MHFILYALVEHGFTLNELIDNQTLLGLPDLQIGIRHDKIDLLLELIVFRVLNIFLAQIYHLSIILPLIGGDDSLNPAGFLSLDVYKRQTQQMP